MRHRFGPRMQIWLGLLVGLAALALAARAIDFGQVWQVLSEVQLLLVLLTLVNSLLTPITKAVRWRWLFGPNRPSLGIGRLASLIVIGQAINFAIPGRLGELARAYLTGEEAGVSKMYALGTIAAEKLVDLVALGVLVVALMPFLALPDWLAAQVGPIVLTALAVAVVSAALLGGRSIWLRLIDYGLRFLPARQQERWRTRIVAGLDGLLALGSRRAALAVWGWTVIFWLVAATTNLLLLMAFDLPASPLIALFLLAVLQSGVAVPSTPGKIGVFHYLSVLALSVFGVPPAIGFGYGLILHFLVVGGISVWAALALWSRSLSLGALTEAGRRMEA